MSKRRSIGACIKDYQTVEVFKRKNPTLTTSEALRQLSITNNSYYKGRRQTNRTKDGLDSSEQHVVAQPIAADSGKLMVLIGTVEQIRGVIQ